MFASIAIPCKAIWTAGRPDRKRMQGPSTFDSRTTARSLAFLFAAGGLVGILTAGRPHEYDIAAGRTVALSAAVVALAITCLRVSVYL